MKDNLQQESDIVKLLYDNSLICKNEFIVSYNKSGKLLPEKLYRELFQKMYYSEKKCNLEAFEYFIADTIALSNYFTRFLIKHIIDDKDRLRNPYKAIIIKCIKNHEKRLEIYECIRLKYNMKYFFDQVKEIEKIDRIRRF